MRLLLSIAAILIIHAVSNAQHARPHVSHHFTPHVTPHNTSSHSSGSHNVVSHGTSAASKTKANSIYESGNYEPVHVLSRNDVYIKNRNNVLVYYTLLHNKNTNKNDTIFSTSRKGLAEIVEYKSNDDASKIVVFVLFMFIVLGAVFYSLRN